MIHHDDFVTYEDFGAVGDGVHDDLPAICEAHAYANAQQRPVRTRSDATYHLGRQALTAEITTDTDWNTSHFIIDDTEVEDHQTPLFAVRSRLAPEEIDIDRLVRDQKTVNVRPESDCHVLVENDAERRYIRRGLNQNEGVPQHDCFILYKDGSIEGAIDWDYRKITRIEARPIDKTVLRLRGGVFETFANQMKQETGYNYWARNIVVTRSNTVVEGVTHYVVGETAVGHPYRGFISAQQCADITYRDCFVSGHKIYSTIGSAGKPVRMGSYDLHANNVVNFYMVGCRMNNICDRTRWGVIGSNFCKNILLEDCTLSRMDTHMGVSNTYTIRGCRLGHMGLNAIGRGVLTVEDSTIYGRSLVNFRSDYGSTWEGEVVIRNTRWVPACGEECRPHLISVQNDGMHDFGYPCSMPREVTIDGVFVDDSNHPEEYDGLYLFSDPDRRAATEELPPLSARSFPYAKTETVRVKGLTTASGREPQISSNAELREQVTVVDEV